VSDVQRAFLTDLSHSILAIKSDAKFSIEDEDADKITWYDDNPSSITKSAILAKQTELQTEYDNNEYARDRAKSYPSVTDFMEAYTEKEIGGDSTKWDAYVVNYNKVRTDNPKG
jgi:hypothetical protein